MGAQSLSMDVQVYELLRPFARMVAEELLEIQKPKEDEPVTSPIGERKLRGISGIMEIFNCSRSHATRIKDSGIIDCAITHISPRVFFTDERKALEAMEKKKPKGGRRY